MRILTLAAVVAGTLAVQQVAPAVIASAPTRWGYTLTEGCAWKPRRWTRALGVPQAPTMDYDARGRQEECYFRKGLRGSIHSVKVLMNRWPSQAELAAWNPRQRAEDEDRFPLPTS